MRIRTLNVMEWQTVNLPSDLDTRRRKAELFRAGHSSAGPSLKFDGRRLAAQGLVGLLSHGKIQLQILPKIYDASEHSDVVKGLNYLQATLPYALSKRFGFKSAFVSKSSESVAGIVIEFFVQCMLEMLQDGLPRDYYEIEEVRNVISGKIDLKNFAMYPPGSLRGVLIRHAPLQIDNSLSRACRAVAAEMMMLTRNQRLSQRLRLVDDLLSDVNAVPLSWELIEKAEVADRNDEWLWLLDFARLLLESSAPSLVEAGGSRGAALLFGLHGLFEDQVRRSLGSGLLRINGGHVSKESAGYLVKSKSENYRALQLKPDLLVEVNGKAAVGDVKWKRVRPSHRPSPEEADAYQILAYARHLAVSKSFLVYPSTNPLENVAELKVLMTSDESIQLGIIQVDPMQLTQSDPLRKRLAEDALASIVSSFIVST